jgi:UDP-N-acetylglucosamine 2-epimerase (non-hydrolysing)
MRILVVFGTRPEAVKMAPVVRELKRRPDRAETVVLTTGQHRQMLDQITRAFQIVTDLDLDLMRPDQTLAELTAESVRRLDEVLVRIRPDAVLVQGDTTTAMAAGLAAFYRRVPVGHVEAGLRTGDRYRPFPEEINRRVISTLATWNFVPTLTAARALRTEGVEESSIHLTGNTVIDALLQITSGAGEDHTVCTEAPVGRRLVLVTAHRRESFGTPFEDLCRGLRDIAARVEDIEIVYPVHLNPNVQEPVRRILGDAPRVRLIEPMDYVAFTRLMKRATLILTDSGGIQEEAPALGVPVLVMRNETERPEAVEAGVARLVGTDSARIVREACALLTDEDARRAMCAGASPFGDGRAAERIVSVLLDGASYPAGRGLVPLPARRS